MSYTDSTAHHPPGTCWSDLVMPYREQGTIGVHLTAFHDGGLSARHTDLIDPVDARGLATVLRQIATQLDKLAPAEPPAVPTGSSPLLCSRHSHPGSIIVQPEQCETCGAVA